MPTLSTPGVYVQEVSTLPPSVAEVETAIPAFMGYTEKGIAFEPVRISSLVEYESSFGKADFEKGIAVVEDDDGDVDVSIDEDKRSPFVMYYALQLYFANGGGPCYIVPVGSYTDATANPPTLDGYKSALDEIGKEDEPTLLVFPDAVYTLSTANYYALQNQSLMQCSALGDRFAVIDVISVEGNTTAATLQNSKDAFRNVISNNLTEAMYGAAYFPFVSTNLTFSYKPEDLQIEKAQNADQATQISDARDELQKTKRDAAAKKAAADAAKANAAANPGDAAATKAAADTLAASVAADKKLTDDTAKLTALEGQAQKKTFADLNNAMQNKVKQQIAALPVVMPPSAAVVGRYADIDNSRGVWKAPANVSLAYVIAPTVKVTDLDQQDFNIDVNAGKSINVIRAFSGKGTLIWGARTLAGNDNEWRYVNVRRFFNMVEESVKKSTNWAVFESNDSFTWTKVRAMIENYLILKWKDGALMGSKPDEAFFVHIGLNVTMTINDVEEGRMIVEIGLAAVRPAEFIVLRFSHYLQDSTAQS